MAKGLTIKNKNNEILYPKTVSELVYNDNQGTTVKLALATKQDTLVSGTNIKTINNTSLLGSGNISIPKGDPGEDGEDAYQPFKGWFDSSSALSTAYPSPQVGDFAYVKGAASTDPVAIYACATAGTWADSGNTFNPANNQEFASGEALNTVHIVDGLESSSATDVLSAKQGKVLDQKVAALGPKIDRIELEEISYSQYPGNNYNPGPTNWARNKGSHIAVPVSDLGGVGATIKLTTEAFGYVCFVTSYTAPTSTSAIPFANAADVTNGNGTTSMSGRITVDGRGAAGQDWYFVIPDNATHFIIGTKDWNGNVANFSLYTVTTISVYDKVYEVENRVVAVEQEITDFDARIAEIEDSRTHIYTQLPLDGYSGNEYNPGTTNWAKGQGAHIAIPISDLGGSGAKIKLTSNPYGYVCFVTSYTAPTYISAIPFAHAAEVINKNRTSTISGRIAITANDVWYLTVPDNASHLILSTKDYEGTDANFVLTLIKEISIQDIANNAKSAYLIDREIQLSNYSQANFNMTDSGWYSTGKHKAIPVSDLGGAGITLALTTTDDNTTHCAFFTNYAVPTANGSPVYFVEHTNCARKRGRDDIWYPKRIQIFKDSSNYITIPSDAVYLIINTVDGVGVDAGVKLFTTFENPLNLNDAVEKIHNEILVKSFSDWVSYEGEQISLKRPKMKVTRLCKTPRCQGMWYRNGYFFNCELITNSRFELYHYENNSLVLKAYWDIQTTVGHTYSEGVHGNSMQPTNIYYDQDDEFPIFTIGGNLNTQRGIIYVMRLYKDGNDEWQLVKLYDVSFDDAHFGIFALEDGTIAGLRNPLVIYNKKITAENTENIVVTSSDISYTYSTTFPDTSMPQGMVHYGNKIFLLEGDSHSQSGGVLTEPGHLMVFDMIIGKCVNDIPLIPLGITVEPEGIDIDDEVMYIAENGQNHNGYLWKLEFD